MIVSCSTNESFEDMRDMWKALYYRRSFDNVNWIYSATHNTGITDYNATEPVVMASKAITLTQHGYKPAVVGVKISQQKLREFMLAHADDCAKDSIICYLLDDGAFVMLSSDDEDALQVGQFFGDIDPLLMSQLRSSEVFLQHMAKMSWIQLDYLSTHHSTRQAHGEDVMDTTGLPEYPPQHHSTSKMSGGEKKGTHEYPPQHQAGTWRRCHGYNWTT
ncbi:hypothetical protein LSAT2_025852 [Lamellibrachia satsuma]|nr:hypothetical protein LSAT2_025852 [Lamellibrachia satsuma]